jgi:hypothetical protein
MYMLLEEIVDINSWYEIGFYRSSKLQSNIPSCMVLVRSKKEVCIPSCMRVLERCTRVYCKRELNMASCRRVLVQSTRVCKRVLGKLVLGMKEQRRKKVRAYCKAQQLCIRLGRLERSKWQSGMLGQSYIQGIWLLQCI